MSGMKKCKKTKINKEAEEDLITKVQRLRMENEYLKKLNALIQEKEKSTTKTKL
ncbi:CenpB-type DNA-binding domain [Thermoanaerobacterium thermosaccharolyticum]|uniref:CenpB-type DNA-binding domain n=1 Tax=Thermoanaerobacterium thermosaccharolyticum TaxID=1517 RepID=A0A223HZ68_THETR|nr:CenpB-type DNA-binding domain [Thermoanaerobacterium thermosaccharolyticum]